MEINKILEERDRLHRLEEKLKNLKKKKNKV
jgi:hypothetical protein